ncbi:hypothetical protein [Methylobacterium radiotolerans]|uniref:hypothetical protein n=1 Tax=Methylobacterium radiotolerans TaxID=31998 RepID=UPI001F2F2E44|nr:hypothetical protein [Methylobacterium radiotolerans]UIY40814.1 hypothetical protein LZ599_20645 [Methylobacterium radiotolerans]
MSTQKFCAVSQIQSDGSHSWAIATEACNLSNPDDALLVFAAQAIRDAYGEAELKALAEDAQTLMELPEPAEGVDVDFDLQNLLAGFREALPNPDNEGNKPPQLTNYRSETAEILAREALRFIFGIVAPPSLHATKGNRNQPILGFDGWSVMKLDDGDIALVLLQVKATDDKKRPPGEAATLIEECRKATVDLEKLKSYLSACIIRCKGTEFAWPLMVMLSKAQKTKEAGKLIVAPVIIRGQVEADHNDLHSLRNATHIFAPALARGVSLSIGAELGAFGAQAMKMARQP